MIPTLDRITTLNSPPRRARFFAAALVAAGIGLAGCGSGSGAPATTAPPGSTTPTGSTAAPGGSTVSIPTSTTASGGAFAAFTGKLQSGENETFSATYQSTGTQGTTQTIQFATAPPHSFAFISDGGSNEFVSNGTTADSCTHDSGSWVCSSLPAAETTAFAGAFQFYEGKFWLTALSEIKAVGAAEGVSVASSTKTVNGFDLQCVTFSSTVKADANGEYCVNGQGILGYVKSATTTFEMTQFSTSVSSSTFQTPAGATITTS
jgi:hypothetical protein